MLRLAHRILSQRLVRCYETDDPKGLVLDEHIGYTGKLLRSSEVILADNIWSYVNSLNREMFFSSDFPCIASPFDSLFIEHGLEDGMDGAEWCRQIGWLVIKSETAAKSSFTDISEYFFVQSFSTWAADERGQPGFLGDIVLVALSKEGRFLDAKFCCAVHHPTEDSLGSLVVPFMTLSLLHCKNVKREETTSSDGPSSKWLRRMKQPRLRYHVLEIEPMKQVLRTEGNVEENGLKKALHICRGHFATYTDEKPLFGRVTGTFWKPAHVRGSIEHGAVVKDYSIKAPGNA